MTKDDQKLKIKKIKNGTVIDHLPAGRAYAVLKIIGIDENYTEPLSVTMNAESAKVGKKDVIKIEGKTINQDETNKIALIAPKATINIIKNREVVEKRHVKLPESIKKVVMCANPNCITNKGEPIQTDFTIEKEDPIRIRCKYCGRIMEMEDIEESFKSGKKEIEE